MNIKISKRCLNDTFGRRYIIVSHITPYIQFTLGCVRVCDEHNLGKEERQLGNVDISKCSFLEWHGHPLHDEGMHHNVRIWHRGSFFRSEESTFCLNSNKNDLVFFRLLHVL